MPGECFFMKIDCHMHTHLCGHAFGEPAEYARSAASKGLDLITITCHIPMEWEEFGHSGTRMARAELDTYVEMVRQAAAEAKEQGVRVLLGIEAEIYPDERHMKTMDAVIASYPFDFVLGSLHHQCRSYRHWLKENGVTERREIIDTYFRHLGEGVRTRRYDSISHPDVIRLYGTVESFDPAEHEESIRGFLSAAAEEDICIEVNTSGLDKGPKIVHPDPLILGWASEMGVRLTIGSDSHNPESVGRYFDSVLPMLKSKGFENLHYFLGRERHETPVSWGVEPPEN